MNYKLIKELIIHYELALESVRVLENRREIIDKCETLVVHIGICKCAYTVFNHFIYLEPWVIANRYSTRHAYWTTPPIGCSTKEEVIDSLNYRINILKQEYERANIKPD